MARVWNPKEAEAARTSERRSVEFSPGILGDYFLEYASTDSMVSEDPPPSKVMLGFLGPQWIHLN